MQINWNELKTDEIEKHIAEAQALIQKREEEKRQEVLEEMKGLAASIGMSFRLEHEEEDRQKVLEEMKVLAASIGESFQLVKTKKAKKKALFPPKYRNPKNPKQTWTGMGRKPPFITDAEARGENIDEFLIKKEESKNEAA